MVSPFASCLCNVIVNVVDLKNTPSGVKNKIIFITRLHKDHMFKYIFLKFK